MQVKAPDIFDLHAAFCTVFSSPTRLRIMWLLSEQPSSVGDLAETLQLSLANVSQHLRVMRDQGAVASTRDGRSVIYRITNPKFVRGAKMVREGLQEELKKRGMST